MVIRDSGFDEVPQGALWIEFALDPGVEAFNCVSARLYDMLAQSRYEASKLLSFRCTSGKHKNETTSTECQGKLGDVVVAVCRTSAGLKHLVGFLVMEFDETTAISGPLEDAKTKAVCSPIELGERRLPGWG